MSTPKNKGAPGGGGAVGSISFAVNKRNVHKEERGKIPRGGEPKKEKDLIC